MERSRIKIGKEIKMSIVPLFIISKPENVFSYDGMIKYKGTAHQTEYCTTIKIHWQIIFNPASHSEKWTYIILIEKSRFLKSIYV